MVKYLLMQIRNYASGTKVKSTDVSFGANVGRGTKVQKQTVVDRNSKIGDHTYIGRRCVLSACQIGRYCSIGDGVSIGLGEHDTGAISTSTLFQREGFKGLIAEPCLVDHDVWIGAESVILRGVSVGRGAVIGANSVVTKDVMPYSIVAGVPARLIRMRHLPEKICRIEESRWWEKDVKDAGLLIGRLEKEGAGL